MSQKQPRREEAPAYHQSDGGRVADPLRRLPHRHLRHRPRHHPIPPLLMVCPAAHSRAAGCRGFPAEPEAPRQRLHSRGECRERRPERRRFARLYLVETAPVPEGTEISPRPDPGNQQGSRRAAILRADHPGATAQAVLRDRSLGQMESSGDVEIMTRIIQPACVRAAVDREWQTIPNLKTAKHGRVCPPTPEHRAWAQSHHIRRKGMVGIKSAPI